MIIGICRNCKGTGNLWYGTGMCVGCSFEALDRENRNLKKEIERLKLAFKIVEEANDPSS